MQMSKKKILIISLALVLVLLLWIFFNKRVNTVSIGAFTSQPLAQNVQFPDESDGKTLRFFTGTAVAELDLDKLKTRSLTKEFSLPRVIDARWSKTALILKTEKPAPDDEVFQPQHDQILKAEPFAWWLLDINTNTISLLNEGKNLRIQDIVWQDDSNFLMLFRDISSNRYSITKRNLGGNQQDTQYIATDKSELVGSINQGLVLKNGTEIYLASESGKVERLPFETARKPLLSKSGILVTEKLVESTPTLANEKQTPRGKLVLYDFSKNKIIGDDIENTGNFSGSNSGLLVLPFLQNESKESKDSLRMAALTSEGKTINLKIDEDSILKAGSIRNVIWIKYQEGSIDILISNTTNELIRISSDKTIIDKKSPYPLLAYRTTGEFMIANKPVKYDGVTNKLTIELNSLTNDLENQKKSVIDAIIASGKDPNLIMKKWMIIIPHDDEHEIIPDNYTGDGYIDKPI